MLPPDFERREHLGPIAIRLYGARDYSEIQEILEGDPNPTGFKLDPAERLIAQVAERPDSILVAEKDGKVVGTVFTSQLSKKAAIYNLGVKTGYRGQGIGTTLILAAEERLRKLGATVLHIEAQGGDPKLLRLYQSLSFRQERQNGKRLVKPLLPYPLLPLYI